MIPLRGLSHRESRTNNHRDSRTSRNLANRLLYAQLIPHRITSSTSRNPISHDQNTTDLPNRDRMLLPSARLLTDIVQLQIPPHRIPRLPSEVNRLIRSNQSYRLPIMLKHLARRTLVRFKYSVLRMSHLPPRDPLNRFILRSRS